MQKICGLFSGGCWVLGAEMRKILGWLISSTPSKPRPDATLVTALELAGLNLWGTQLVVLSACDTGRGDVKPGQGVYGLCRALVVASADTVVMSMWKGRWAAGCAGVAPAQ
jgi:hypothetical protein